MVAQRRPPGSPATLPIIAVACLGTAAMLLAPAGPSRTAGASGPSPSVGTIARLGFEVVTRRPHDTTAWTQGLLYAPDGRLYESTGRLGRSQLRELDPMSGGVLRAVALPDDAFGEGLALVGDRLVQLTWDEGIAFSWNLDTFEPLGTHGYAGEGWGLCHDGSRLVMSDGSDRLTFRDPVTFEIVGDVAVAADGVPVRRLNELECVDGAVWANVYETDRIVRIDAATGRVTGELDATGLPEPHPALADRGAVLNGIARVPDGDTWLLTGKLWPEAVEVRITEEPEPG